MSYKTSKSKSFRSARSHYGTTSGISIGNLFRCGLMDLWLDVYFEKDNILPHFYYKKIYIIYENVYWNEYVVNV